MDGGFTGLLVVAAVAFAAPLTAGLWPGLRVPAVVLEIAGGIVVGPFALGWVGPGGAVEVLALVGLAFLLFLAGLEVDLGHLRGERLRLAVAGFAATLALGLAAGWALAAAGVVESASFTAVVLSATSLGVVIPVLKDAGEARSPFGQLVIAGASVADFATVVLLAVLFTGEGGSPGATLVTVAGLFLLTAAAVTALRRAPAWRRLGTVLVRLQDTTAQIRVRGAFLFLAAWVALAQELGLEVILGAFTAGAALALLDRDREMTHPAFRGKLEAAGYGVFVPVFFVASGVAFDLGALMDRPATLAHAPLFLAALMLVRGVPALLYRRAVGMRRAVAAGLLQATSLPFIVAATMIGTRLGVVSDAAAAAMVTAGLLSVLVFPPVAAALLRSAGRDPQAFSAAVSA